ADDVDGIDTLDEDVDGDGNLTNDDTDGDKIPNYLDTDDDGFGAIQADPIVSCAPPGAQYTLFTLDCDDSMGDVSPAAEERCNGRDDNCNGQADFVIGPQDTEDDDGDGVADSACGGTDCDDRSASTYPGAPERLNGRDDDCDGRVDESLTSVPWYADTDSDGFGDPNAVMNAASA
ncbi:MAG: putative metal-binding motif-containing protein, partial [Myxococcales bacterium]|nr:putative metal-binding motif-containing protein [Myxococcales bacterium]